MEPARTTRTRRSPGSRSLSSHFFRQMHFPWDAGVIHSLFGPAAGRSQNEACMIREGIYRGLVLRVFGSDAMEACRVKPAGFTISGAASTPALRQVHSSDVR